MCRMLAIMPRSGHKLDSEIVRSFQNLASCGLVPRGVKAGHSDGWGMVSWIDEKPRYLGREPTDALKDKKYDLACREIDNLGITSPILVHLRKASVGLKIRENTHPFVIREWAFAHNGTIRKLNLKVTTDSQWFFESLMRGYERNNHDMFRAIRDQINAVHGIYPYTSITFILSDGKQLYAYRDCTKNFEYYGMYFTSTRDSFVLCQEKFFASNWKELGNGELVKVDSDASYMVSRPVEPITATT
jgi:predicted glutamine amidotransferase